MRFQTIPTLCCTLLLSSVPGLAQDIYFNPGDAVGSRATESGNWDNSTAAWWDGEDETETKVAWGSIADARKAAYFYGPNPGTASYTITLSEDVQAQSVRFNSGNYTLDGAGVLALNGGFTVLGNKTVVVKNDIYLNNIGYTSTQSRTFGGSNNGSLTLEGSLSLSPSTERTHSLTVNFQTGNASGVIALKGDNSGLVPVFTGIGGDRIVFGGAGHLDLHNDTVLGGMLLHLGNAAYKLRAVNGPLTFGNEFRPLGENGQIGIAGDHDITFTRSIAADETGNRNLVVHAHDAGVLTIGGYISATPGGLRDARSYPKTVGNMARGLL